MQGPGTIEKGLSPALGELAQALDRAVPPGETCVRRGPLWALRCTRPIEPKLAVYTPMLCVIAQGAKQILVGDERLLYDSGRFLLNTLSLPASGGVIEASEARPCLWIMIELDPSLIAEVVLASGIPDAPPEGTMRAIDASPIDAALLDPVVRLARLLDSPEDVEFLAPLLLREVLYRLLRGDQAPRLRQAATHGGEAERVRKAVEWLRRHFHEPMSIEGLAHECGLSPSALHRHFKRVTAMTPVQFQRQMRLQEAKRLMVGEGLDAAGAGIRVGYDDPSYFSREYRRFFGDPPRRHVARLRSTAAPWDLVYR